MTKISLLTTLSLLLSVCFLLGQGFLHVAGETADRAGLSRGEKLCPGRGDCSLFRLARIADALHLLHAESTECSRTVDTIFQFGRPFIRLKLAVLSGS